MIAARQIFLGRGGAKLPYDAEVEYLESTGTQWIDTGIRPAQNLSFAVEFNNLNANVGHGNVFGSRLASSDNEYQVTVYNGGSVGVGRRYSVLRFGANEINTITYNGIDELNINGTVKEIVPQSCELAIGNILLFGINQNGVAMQFANCRIYNVKFGNVRDFIPVRKGGVGYMYDRVSGQLFGNQGSGNFIVGPDVVEVEYLESTGTQWIDTGVKLNSNHVVSLLGMPNNANSFFGSVESGKPFNLTGSRGVSRLYYGGSGGYDAPITFSTTHTYVCGRDFIVDGELKHTFNAPDFSSSVNALLFARQANSAVDDKLTGRIYWLKIEESSILVRNFVPVRVGVEGAMMDRLTRKIYRNAGTGAFSYGPDK